MRRIRRRDEARRDHPRRGCRTGMVLRDTRPRIWEQAHLPTRILLRISPRALFVLALPLPLYLSRLPILSRILSTLPLSSPAAVGSIELDMFPGARNEEALAFAICLLAVAVAHSAPPSCVPLPRCLSASAPVWSLEQFCTVSNSTAVSRLAHRAPFWTFPSPPSSRPPSSPLSAFPPLAPQLGMQVNDQIVSVNGKETGKLMYEQIRDLLQASGETLTIEVVAA